MRTYLGGKEHNKHESKKRHAGRGPVGKQAVMGMREREGNTHLTCVDRADAGTMQGEIRANVQEGSTVYTDDHRAYCGLNGFTHETVKHSAKEYVNGNAHTNGIESVWALVKRGYYGTYHNFSMKHAQRYVNEVEFRMNDGRCDIDTIDRMWCLGQVDGWETVAVSGFDCINV